MGYNSYKSPSCFFRLYLPSLPTAARHVVFAGFPPLQSQSPRSSPATWRMYLVLHFLHSRDPQALRKPLRGPIAADTGLSDTAQGDGAPNPAGQRSWLWVIPALPTTTTHSMPSHLAPTHPRMRQWQAGKDCKRPYHLFGWERSEEVISSLWLGGIARGHLVCLPRQDADDVSGRCLSNQFLHHIPRHFVPQHLQSSAGVPLLLPLSSANVETRLSIFFSSWCLNEDLCSLPLHKNLNNLKTFHFPKDFFLWLLLSQPNG